MHNLLNSKKAQFFVLSAFAIVTILYFISSWIEPYTIIDTSAVVFREEPFIFNNIKEKAIEVVKISNSCEELEYNLDEYKNFVENYVLRRGVVMLTYTLSSPCYEEEPQSFPIVVLFNLKLKSTSLKIESDFKAFWPS